MQIYENFSTKECGCFSCFLLLSCFLPHVFSRCRTHSLMRKSIFSALFKSFCYQLFRDVDDEKKKKIVLKKANDNGNHELSHATTAQTPSLSHSEYYPRRLWWIGFNGHIQTRSIRFFSLLPKSFFSRLLPLFFLMFNNGIRRCKCASNKRKRHRKHRRKKNTRRKRDKWNSNRCITREKSFVGDFVTCSGFCV